MFKVGNLVSTTITWDNINRYYFNKTIFKDEIFFMYPENVSFGSVSENIIKLDFIPSSKIE